MRNLGLLVICGPLLTSVAILVDMIVQRVHWPGRRILKMKELLALFDGGPLVEEALRKLSDMYGIPVGVLRPDDRLWEKGRLFSRGGEGRGPGSVRLDELLCGSDEANRLPENWTVGDYVSWYVGKKMAGALKDIPFRPLWR